MKAHHLCLPLLFATAACGQAPTGPGLEAAGLPVLAVGDIYGFGARDAMTGVSSLVVAVDRDGKLHRAGIDSQSGWPVLLLDDGSVRRLPGEAEPLYNNAPNPAQTLAMRAVGDALHLVWTDQTHVHYGRANLDGGAWEHLQVGQAYSGTANLAVRPTGEVVITYTKGQWSRTPMRKLVVVEGTLEDGFSEPVHVNPACCGVDWAEEQGAYDVSVAAVELDRVGAIHIAYVWSYDGRGALDYVTNASGKWEAAGRISVAPAWLRTSVGMAIGPDGIDFVHSGENNLDLLRVRYEGGALTAPQQIYAVPIDGDPITRIQMNRDGAGVLHLAVQQQAYGRLGDRSELVYVRVDGPDVTSMPMIPRETGSRQPQLAIGAGGSAIMPARWIVPFSRPDGTSELAVGFVRH